MNKPILTQKNQLQRRTAGVLAINKQAAKALRIAILLSIFHFGQTSCASAQRSAEEYLNEALNIIQTQALRGSTVDWAAVKSHSFSLARNARSSSDTYPAIRYALAQLKDNHSFLMSPNGSVEPNPYTSNKTVIIPKESVRQKGNRVITSSRGPLGIIVVPQHANKDRSTEFATNLRRFLANAKAQRITGWIVDLRDNAGGDMWPMLVGVGPINTAGVQGFFNYANMSVPWFYEHGEAGVDTKSGKYVNFKVSDNVPDFGDSVPLAVLVNGRTASSGEAVAISFHGRPHSRFFGTHTAGLSTSNEIKKLSDGATIYLTTSVESDRQKRVFPSGLEPDEVVEQADIPLGADSDPVIKSAIRWLSSTR